MWPWLLIYFGHQAINTMRFLSYSVASGGAGWSAEVELMEWPGAALSRGAGGGDKHLCERGAAVLSTPLLWLGLAG